MDAWYFAYGSNLSVRQLVARVGRIDVGTPPPRVAVLAGHRLVFQRLASAGPAYANIVAPGEGLIGVVYRLNDEQFARLDRFESGYDRRTIQVTDRQGELVAAETYVMRPALVTGDGPPSVEYLARILSGANEHGLPAEYLAGLQKRAGAGPADSG